jgi:hypothetical protein
VQIRCKSGVNQVSVRRVHPALFGAGFERNGRRGGWGCLARRSRWIFPRQGDPGWPSQSRHGAPRTRFTPDLHLIYTLIHTYFLDGFHSQRFWGLGGRRPAAGWTGRALKPGRIRGCAISDGSLPILAATYSETFKNLKVGGRGVGVGGGLGLGAAPARIRRPPSPRRRRCPMARRAPLRGVNQV